MDYKLEALHKERENRAFMVGLLFFVFILSFLVFMVLFAFLGNLIFAIIGLSSLVAIIFLIIAVGGGWILPDWLCKAEREYQYELCRIAMQKRVEKEAFRAKLKKVTGHDVSYLDGDSIRYLMENFGYIVDVLEKLQANIDEKTIKAKANKSTLDKKLEPKKKGGK